MFIINPADVRDIYIANLVYAWLIQAQWDLQLPYGRKIWEIWTLIFFGYTLWVQYFAVWKLHRINHLKAKYNDLDASGMDATRKEEIWKELVGLRAENLLFEEWWTIIGRGSLLELLFQCILGYSCDECRTGSIGSAIAVPCTSGVAKTVKMEVQDEPNMAAFAKKLEQESMTARRKDLDKMEE